MRAHEALSGLGKRLLARFSRRWLHGFGDRKGGSGAGVGLGGSAWMSMTVLAGVMSLGAGGQRYPVCGNGLV